MNLYGNRWIIHNFGEPIPFFVIVNFAQKLYLEFLICVCLLINCEFIAIISLWCIFFGIKGILCV